VRNATAPPVASSYEHRPLSAKAHLARLHDLPCIICTRQGTEQTTRTTAHHLEHIRDELSDYSAISICATHHEMLHAMSRRSFEMQTKLTPIDMLSLTIMAMEERGMIRDA
jgi:hypothetical protein